MSADIPLIVIVEDDTELARMLDDYFGGQGYRVIAVDHGEEAVRVCKAQSPDLVLLDIRLPDIDGYEVAHRLRTARKTKDIPIIFLTEKRSRSDRLHGLELGADDYITKPFDIQELRLRVRNALRRSDTGPLNNPVTGLPVGQLVDERLRECLGQDGWAILYVRLDNLDCFRETYGFVASDDVLRAISLMIHNAVRDLGQASDFVGQISSMGFIVVTQPHTLPGLAERIRSRLDQALDYFYPLKDRGLQENQAQRLCVHLSQLAPNQGPFHDLDALKTQILQSRGRA